MTVADVRLDHVLHSMKAAPTISQAAKLIRRGGVAIRFEKDGPTIRVAHTRQEVPIGQEFWLSINGEWKAAIVEAK